jgi:prepilin-type N-terminal cleavage/methylation domain-containing protein
MSKRPVLQRAMTGFTLVELLVVVILIGVLASIAVPNYMAQQRKAKITSLKGNMHASQLAAEAMAVDTGGNYATDPGELAPYYPGGGSAPGGSAGTFPTNPYSNVANETPGKCIVNGTMWITLLRQTRGTANFGGITGQTSYTGIADAADVTYNNSFAITGNGDNGIAVQAFDGYAVLSNM